MYLADDKRYDSMQYRRSGKSGIKLPAVSLGLWHNFGGDDNFENSRAMLRRAFDLESHISISRTTTVPPTAPRKKHLAKF
jgi:Predicted oxidoreductases (related to aryl-alcohol dehydrogenases)